MSSVRPVTYTLNTTQAVRTCRLPWIQMGLRVWGEGSRETHGRDTQTWAIWKPGGLLCSWGIWGSQKEQTLKKTEEPTSNMMTRRAECRGDPIQRMCVCVYPPEYVVRTLLKLLLVGTQQPFSDLLQGPMGRKSHPPTVPLSSASARYLLKYKPMTTNIWPQYDPHAWSYRTINQPNKWALKSE